MMSLPVQVAKAALAEAGFPELAEHVWENRAGMPALHCTDETLRPVIFRAFLLGHQTVHPEAHEHRDGGIWCPVCST
jgi:hypothetical protein